MPSGAEKCFKENRNLFGNPSTQPEKFNLYNGLLNLAEMVGQLKSQVSHLEHEIHNLRRELGQR